jgi:hypothetical protein
MGYTRSAIALAITLATLLALPAATATAATVAAGGTGSTGAGGFVLATGNTIVDVGNPHYTLVPTTPASGWVWDVAGAIRDLEIEFRFAFDLTGFDAATASLSGLWGIDNIGSVRLNGVTIAALPSVVLGNFETLHGFAASGPGASFNAGANLLSFFVVDKGASAGFRASVLVEASEAPVSPVPLPAGMPLLAIGLVSLALIRRRHA